MQNRVDIKSITSAFNTKYEYIFVNFSFKNIINKKSC